MSQQRQSLNVDPDEDSSYSYNNNNSTGQDPLLTTTTTTTAAAPINADNSTNVNVVDNDNDNDDNYSPLTSHLKTYTAGEDKSRLAAAAKALGLQQARQPRRQVRNNSRRHYHHHRRQYSSSLLMVPAVLLDTAMEDARIRSIYSSHLDLENDALDHDFFVSAEWGYYAAAAALGGIEEEEEEEAVDEEAAAHGVAGGDLVAAVLGIIKGMVGPGTSSKCIHFHSAKRTIHTGWLFVVSLIILLFLYSLIMVW